MCKGLLSKWSGRNHNSHLGNSAKRRTNTKQNEGKVILLCGRVRVRERLAAQVFKMFVAVNDCSTKSVHRFGHGIYVSADGSQWRLDLIGTEVTFHVTPLNVLLKGNSLRNCQENFLN